MAYFKKVFGLNPIHQKKCTRSLRNILRILNLVVRKLTVLVMVNGRYRGILHQGIIRKQEPPGIFKIRKKNTNPKYIESVYLLKTKGIPNPFRVGSLFS